MTENGINRDDDPTVGGETRWRQVTQRQYDPDRDGDLTAAIVFAVAEAEGVPASEVDSPPLHDVVNVGAIERALFGHESRGGSERVAGTVGFRYRDGVVRVRSDGWVLVYEPADNGFREFWE